MAGREIHRRDCKILLGNDFIEVHQWLDATTTMLHKKMNNLQNKEDV